MSRLRRSFWAPGRACFVAIAVGAGGVGWLCVRGVASVLRLRRERLIERLRNDCGNRFVWSLFNYWDPTAQSTIVSLSYKHPIIFLQQKFLQIDFFAANFCRSIGFSHVASPSFSFPIRWITETMASHAKAQCT